MITGNSCTAYVLCNSVYTECKNCVCPQNNKINSIIHHSHTNTCLNNPNNDTCDILCRYHSKLKNCITVHNIEKAHLIKICDYLKNKKCISKICNLSLIKTLMYYKLPCHKSIKNNKEELLSFFSTFLIYYKNIDKILYIQACIRGFLLRRIQKLQGPGLFKPHLCINSEDILTSDNYRDIDICYFFSIIDSNKKIYFFDVRSFLKLIKSQYPDNPYNQQPIEVENIDRFYKLYEIYKYRNINLKIEDIVYPEGSPKEIEMMAFDVFMNIDILGYYTNSDWFTALDKRQLIQLYKYMADIWYYRANLTPEQQSDIRPDGKTFIYELSRHNKQTAIQKVILEEIKNFTTLGRTKSDKFNGATYVLIALAMVSKTALERLPNWLVYCL